MRDLVNWRLFTPGPVEVSPEVLLEQAFPLTHHRTPEFRDNYKMVLDNLKTIVGLQDGSVFLLPSSGTGAMEAAVVNLFSPGDRVLVLCNGFFSERFAEIGQVYQLDVRRLEFEWGSAVDPTVLDRTLQQDGKIKGVLSVFHDTSTGVVNDLRSIGEVASRYSILLVVDAITGIAVSPLCVGEWNIDCVVGASQKGLMSPPGISFIALNQKAMEACHRSIMPRYYYDLRKFEAVLNGTVTPSPWTPPVSTIRSLKKSIDIILAVGLDQHYKNRRQLAECIQVGIEAIGLKLPVKKYNRSDAVTLVLTPDGIAPETIIASMKDDWGIILAGALGKFKDVAFRVGHIGDISLLDAVGFLFALEVTLHRSGYPCNPGASATAVQDIIR